MPALLADALRFAAAPRGLLEHLATPADLDAAHEAALAAFAAGKAEGGELRREAEEVARWHEEQTAALRAKRPPDPRQGGRRRAG